METKQSVYNILAAKSVKVELGAVEDLAKGVKFVQEGQKLETLSWKTIDKFRAAAAEAGKVREKLDFELANLKSYQKFIDSAVAKVDAMAKELGVDPNTIANYKEVVSNNYLRVNIENVTEVLRMLPKGKA
jgi:hypothetical protein